MCATERRRSGRFAPILATVSHNSFDGFVVIVFKRTSSKSGNLLSVELESILLLQIIKVLTFEFFCHVTDIQSLIFNIEEKDEIKYNQSIEVL